MTEVRTELEGLAFPEGPRWHDGRLFFSDQHDRRVLALAPDGTAEEIVTVEQQPSGLGWTPAGRLLVVSMIDRRLLRLDPDGLTEVADLHALAPYHCNDMVVAADGTAYVGNFGFDLDAGAPMCTTTFVAVAPDGAARIVAEEMEFPNGTVITPDGSTLIVAETVGRKLTAFTIAADGSLTDRRVWAQLDGIFPDGICLDEQGAIWVACPFSARIVRIAEGGEVLDSIDAGGPAFACMLGGDDRRTLYICTSKMALAAENRAEKPGRIRSCRVDVAGAGLP